MTIPSELQRSTPRSVSLSSVGRRTIRTACLNFALVLAMAGWLQLRGNHSVSGDRGGEFFSTLARIGAGLLIGVLIGLARVRHQSGLLINGRATVALVTGEAKRWWKLSGRGRGRIGYVHCEFRLLSGGLGKAIVKVCGQIPAPGSEIVVLYDPDEPDHATIYPYGLLKVKDHDSSR